MASENNTIHAGIDFGTTHSGFSYTFAKAQDTLECFFGWANQPKPYCKDKTAILYEFNHSIWSPVAFGYTAWSKYKRQRQTTNLFYVEKFKLLLDAHSDFHIELPNGISEERLFSDYLGYMKEMCLTQVKSQIPQSEQMRIKWGITVPAMWSDRSKQIMRKAAYQAGLIEALQSEDMHICLEPEAAAIYCIFKDETTFKEGDVVTICDAGGGTVDISTYKVLSEHRLSEIIPSDGISAGSTFIDDQFLNFYKEKVGAQAYEKAIQSSPALVSKVLTDWEGCKTSFQGTPEELKDDELFNVAIPNSLIRHMEEEQEEITISGSQMASFFDPILLKTTSLLIKHISKAQASVHYPPRSSHILLFVGGFSGSKYAEGKLRAIERQLGLHMFVPPHSPSSIVQGAALFSRNPTTVPERAMKLTIGVGVRLHYNEEIHKAFEHLKVRADDGEFRIENGFDAFVREGQIVRFDEVFKKTYYPQRMGQEEVNFRLYANEKPEGFLINSSCKELGLITCRIPLAFQFCPKYENGILVELNFGKTEISMKATHIKSGESCESTLQFSFA
jgi:hypothetical protein